MKKIFYLLSVFVMFSSCNNDDILKDTESDTTSNYASKQIDEEEKPDVHMPIVLGEKLENPYTVTNMQKAFDYYNSVVPNSPFHGITVKASHYYIKIIPSTLEDLEMLDQLDNSDDANAPVLHDYPLDYKIEQEGDYYVMPKKESDIYHPAYTVIPVNYQFPSSISYEIIDEIYEPADGNQYDVETVALFFADWQEDLLADGIELTLEKLPEYLNESLARHTSTNKRLLSKKYLPQGYVKILNTDDQNLVPLQKAKISIGRNIFWRYTYTDDEGYFKAPKRYRGKVRIRAKWRGNTATIRKTFNEMLGLWVSDHLMTITKGSNGRTKNIMYGGYTGLLGSDFGHLWFKGTTHNGLRKYNDFAGANGISHPVKYANAWCWSNGGNSSTPMLNKYRNLAEMAAFANIGQANLWNAMISFGGSAVINLVPPHLRPDFFFQNLKNKTIKANGQANTVMIHQLVFHESGHYSHASKAGASFWAKLFASEMSNTVDCNRNPYCNGSKPSYQAAKRIGLAEGWATLCEYKITSAIYGKARMKLSSGTGIFNTNAINAYMENFNMYTVPTSNDFDDAHWFAHGVMWDVLDANEDSYAKFLRDNGTFITSINDKCYLGDPNSPNDLSPIFNRLNSGVESGEDLGNALYHFYSNATVKAQIYDLFKSYGYYGY